MSLKYATGGLSSGLLGIKLDDLTPTVRKAVHGYGVKIAQVEVKRSPELASCRFDF